MLTVLAMFFNSAYADSQQGSAVYQFRSISLEMASKAAWGAINKLLFRQPLRYSEDIDLVQTEPEPIGSTIDAIRDVLAWLGKCKRHQAGHSMHLVFKFAPEVDPEVTLKLKVEINTREHESLYGITEYPFEVDSSWYQAKISIPHLHLRNCLEQSFALCFNGVKTVTCLTYMRGSCNCRWILTSLLPASSITWRWRVRRSLELGPVNTNPIGPVAPEKAPIKARGERFGDSK